MAIRYLVDDTTGAQLVDDTTGAWLIADAPIYELSGIALLRNVFDQMVLDQSSGAVKFAGGSETWVVRPTGWFKAKLTPDVHLVDDTTGVQLVDDTTGAPLVDDNVSALAITTTAILRARLETLRVNFDLLAASAGVLATRVAIAAQSPPFTLASGSFSASGAVTAGTQIIANTNYNLSSLATLQTVAVQMTADQQTGVTNFGGGTQPNTFLAILEPAQNAVMTTMEVVRARFAAARASFDRLDQ